MLQRVMRTRNSEFGMRNERRRKRRRLLPFAIRYSLFAMSAPLVLLAAGGLPEWMTTGWSYLLLILGFSLVIFVHELGHFTAAKWAGVRVERFAIGFGKELFGFTKGETRYSFNVLPLGGYVKMLGQEDFVVDKSGELKVKQDPNSFTNKSIAQRMVIISAGVIMNLIFAAVAFAVVVMVGRPQPPAVVGQVVETSAAARAGLQTGDRILAINGTKVESFGDLSARITLSDPDEELVLDVVRDGERVEPPPRVKPVYKKNVSMRQIGVGPGMNLRVADTTLRPGDSPRDDELKKFDEFYRLMVKDEAKEFKDLGVFRRAVVQAQGAPVEVIVKRPKNPEAMTEEAAYKNDADVESVEAKVRIRAIWWPVPYEPEEEVSGSLMGLVPRMTVLYVEPGKSFDRAGVEAGDVISKIGDNEYPSYSILKKKIEESDGAQVAIEVRRPARANGEWSATVVRMCAAHRETLIEAAKTDVKQALAMAGRLAKSEGLRAEDAAKLINRLEPLADAPAWRRWLERVDIHKLKPIVPKAPFALFGKTTPTIDAGLRCFDEDHVVVSDILPAIGDRVSPAKESTIPVGAVILACDGRSVGRWQEFSELLRSNVGKTVDVKYRVADEVRVAKITVPNCISSALAMPFGSRIIRIAGKDSYLIKNPDNDAVSIALPDWRAIQGLLKESVGKTVPVEYVTPGGEKKSGRYAVTAENTDPWLQRILYVEPFICYPLLERHRVSNPIAAAGDGFKQAYQATVQTVLSIKHMLITRQVGLSKVSGPVGIIRLGSRFAGSSTLDLLWFLAVISANLAVLNFLPLPIVDGGLFLFLILEKVRGEPVSIKTQVATQLVGIALIATVFILVTYQDIKNWITGT